MAVVVVVIVRGIGNVHPVRGTINEVKLFLWWPTDINVCEGSS